MRLLYKGDWRVNRNFDYQKILKWNDGNYSILIIFLWGKLIV